MKVTDFTHSIQETLCDKIYLRKIGPTLPEDELKVLSPHSSHLLQLESGHYAQNLLKKSLGSTQILSQKKKSTKTLLSLVKAQGNRQPIKNEENFQKIIFLVRLNTTKKYSDPTFILVKKDQVGHLNFHPFDNMF